MPKKPEYVEVQTKLIATFFYDVSKADSYYRHVEDGRWIPEQEWMAGDCEKGGDMQDAERIVDDMIEGLLGLDCIERACTDPMCPWVEVKLWETKHTQHRIKDAIEACVTHLVAGRPVRTEKAPYIYNRSGNPNYWDPETITPKFQPPAAAKAALLGRKVVSTKKMKR